jgi:hypothetical protein
MTLARTILPRLTRSVPLVVALLVGSAVAAAAQWPGSSSAPTAAGPSPFDNPPAAPPGARAPSPFDNPPASPFGGSPQQPPCMDEFMPMRQEAEKRAGLIREAGKKKAPREEICKLLQAFATAEGKMLKFVETKSQQCAIPPQVAGQLKASHERTLKARTQVCSAAAGAGAAAAPSLSDALGTSRSPIPETTPTGRSTFDTLTGNALAR